MFQTFISRHNSNFFSDKLVLTSVTPASSAPVLQTPKATSSTLYFDSLTVHAGNGAIAGGIASALAGGAMSKLFGGGQKAASGGIQGDVLATDNNTVGMGDAGIKSAIQGSNVPNPDEAVPSFVSGAMAKAGKGLLEGTLQAGTSAVSDKLLDLVGLGGKSAADKGKDTRD